MFNENENYFFVKYGETADEEQAMWKTILNLFRSHGVEDDKLQYIREVVNSKLNILVIFYFFLCRALFNGDKKSKRKK